MVNVQYYRFLTNIVTETKICESETTFFNFVNLPKREKAPLTRGTVNHVLYTKPRNSVPRALHQTEVQCTTCSTPNRGTVNHVLYTTAVSGKRRLVYFASVHVTLNPINKSSRGDDKMESKY
ncbi:hypothetical protein DPMN_063312 [Dreissena polymorpha]|uniref:Uncharacterized protein n=1 Tax=Dreissena polymorpha TaxID=45954 RepID=A0A9D4CA98_DREPO|nr:hypothetical protein DPMN_063312 [Dreissena polymorpha]